MWISGTAVIRLRLLISCYEVNKNVVHLQA
jgi:hypothetical protein